MRSSEAAIGRGGAQRPVLRGNELKKTGARTRGQNPLVENNTLYRTSCLPPPHPGARLREIIFSEEKVFGQAQENTQLENNMNPRKK
jgi:hypothetical protein